MTTRAFLECRRPFFRKYEMPHRQRSFTAGEGLIRAGSSSTITSLKGIANQGTRIRRHHSNMLLCGVEMSLML